MARKAKKETEKIEATGKPLALRATGLHNIMEVSA